MRIVPTSVVVLLLLCLAACQGGGSVPKTSEAMCFRGTVSSKSSDAIFMNGTRFLINSGTQYFNANGAGINGNAFHVGDYAVFDAVRQPSNSLLMTKAQVLDDTSEDLEAAGNISLITADSVVINGIEWMINEDTEFFAEGNSFATLGSFHVGQMAQVEGPQSNGVFTASGLTTDVESCDVGHAEEEE